MHLERLAALVASVDEGSRSPLADVAAARWGLPVGSAWYVRTSASCVFGAGGGYLRLGSVAEWSVAAVRAVSEATAALVAQGAPVVAPRISVGGHLVEVLASSVPRHQRGSRRRRAGREHRLGSTRRARGRGDDPRRGPARHGRGPPADRSRSRRPRPPEQIRSNQEAPPTAGSLRVSKRPGAPGGALCRRVHTSVQTTSDIDNGAGDPGGGDGPPPLAPAARVDQVRLPTPATLYAHLPELAGGRPRCLPRHRENP